MLCPSLLGSFGTPNTITIKSIRFLKMLPEWLSSDSFWHQNHWETKLLWVMLSFWKRGEGRKSLGEKKYIRISANCPELSFFLNIFACRKENGFPSCYPGVSFSQPASIWHGEALLLCLSPLMLVRLFVIRWPHLLLCLKQSLYIPFVLSSCMD